MKLRRVTKADFRKMKGGSRAEAYRLTTEAVDRGDLMKTGFERLLALCASSGIPVPEGPPREILRMAFYSGAYHFHGSLDLLCNGPERGQRDEVPPEDDRRIDAYIDELEEYIASIVRVPEREPEEGGDKWSS